MVREIRLDDLDIGREFKLSIRASSRRNKMMIDESMIFQSDPDCPRLNCEERGTTWRCYQGFYNECEVYGR